MTEPDFTVALDDLTFVGESLRRPECVLATARGDLFVSDRDGVVAWIGQHGRRRPLGLAEGLLANGIALERAGTFLIANLHAPGGVWRLDRQGACRPVLTEVDGVALDAVNFVRLDRWGRTWITANPQIVGDRYPTETPRGLIALLDERGARVVADRIGWANECVIDQTGEYLYVNETFGRRLTRFRIDPAGTLSDRTCVTEFGPGAFPDGLALDEEGSFWVVSVASNRVTRIAADGRQHNVLEDANTLHLSALEVARDAHALTRSALTGLPGRLLRNLTSIAFGGPDRRTAYLGSVGGDRLVTFRAPVAGVSPVHWHP